MRNLSIKLKLILSFLTVAILTSILAIYSINSISKSSDGFDSYREMARDTVLASSVQANMLMVRLNVKDYIESSDSRYISEFDYYYEIASKLIEKKKTENKISEQASQITKLDDELKEYKELFDKLVDLSEERNILINDNFKVNGVKIEKLLLSIMDSVEKSKNVKVSLEISKGIQTMLFARLYTSRYLLFNTYVEHDRVLNEFSNLARQLITIEQTLKDSENKEKLIEAINAINTYRNGILKIDLIITERNKVVKDGLNKIGPDIAQISDEIKLSIKQEQDKIGPAVKKLNENINNFILIISFIILALVIALAIWIPQNISHLIEKFQTGLLSFFKYLNKETQEVKLIEIDSKDEIGQMSSAVNEGIIKAEEIISKDLKESWIKDGVTKLNQILVNQDTVEDVTREAVKFICQYLNAGVGVLYKFNKNENSLTQYASFAHTVRDSLSVKFELGEGLIGQVALQKEPILLKNIQKESAVITTGTTSQPAFNTYTFPFVYNDELLGVIEIGSVESINEDQREFIDVCNRPICVALSNAIQDKKVKELLENTKKANKQLEENQLKLEEANAYMEEQQQQLEEANANMEEQQQQLEEANANMEEQQQQLKVSEQNLILQNQKLEETKKEITLKAEELQKSGQYKSEFLANMSHELRTPLNSIILLSSLLQKNSKKTLNNDDIKKAKTIFDSGNDLLRLINDILDLSKVESGKMQVIIDNIKSKDMLAQIKDTFEFTAIDKGLEFKIIDEYNSLIKNDKDKIAQIIRNLVSNAFKFTKEGSITVKIEPSKDLAFRISVIDTGIGIPLKKQDLIFKAFTQADGSTSREYGGTGLGLSITRELTKLLGGYVDVSSTEGEGSIFSVDLPNLSNDDIEQIENNNQVEVKSVERPKSVKTNVPIVEVVNDDRESLQNGDKPYLVVDDDQMFAEVVYEEIKKDGSKALIAHTGTTALELISKYDVKGVLLDLTLPDMDGVDVLKEIKSNSKTRHIPVHVISSKDKNNETLELGAIGYLQKPVFDGDINSVIETIDSFKEKEIKDLLIVEDNEVQREALIELIGEGVNITGVNSVKEAINEVKKEKYDTVVVDLGLDNESGYEICEFVKNSYPDLPIIIYTGKDLTKEEKIKLQEYSNSIIIKTVNSNERILHEINLFLHRDELEEEEEESNEIFETVDLEGTNILIVDDDIKNIFVLDAALKEFNATTFTAFNGQEALDFLNENNNIDLVLMDIMMPIMNGYEAIENIRKSEKLKEIPVVAVTAKAMKEDREKCIQVGADDYMSKPIDINVLSNLIKVWSNKKHK